jgi:hypothetical protein
VAAANAGNGTLLEDTQQFALQSEVESSNFVEKQGAGISLFEVPGPGLVSPGERALFVAEQFRLNQRFGNSGAVNADERLVLPRPQRNDRSRR